MFSHVSIPEIMEEEIDFPYLEPPNKVDQRVNLLRVFPSDMRVSINYMFGKEITVAFFIAKPKLI